MKFVLRAINNHKESEIYQTAKIAEEYDRKNNLTIVNFEKTFVDAMGRIMPDKFSPNHKMRSNFYHQFTMQQVQYLLSNGVKWKNESTAKKLGKNFNNELKRIAKASLDGGVGWGFWNFDGERSRMVMFKVGTCTNEPVFMPWEDEENGMLMSGVRFWQLDTKRPTFAELYEVDGKTVYKFESGKDGEIVQKKTPYKIFRAYSEISGYEYRGGENYPMLPIVPLWNTNKQSEIVGMRELIDCYDLMSNAFANDLDGAQILWALRGAQGMNQEELVKLIEIFKATGIINPSEGQEIQPIPVNIPYEAREQLLNRIKADLYSNYGAVNIDEIKSGNVVNAQIRAVFDPLDKKTDEFEYNVTEFLDNFLKVVGIEDEVPKYKRSLFVNSSEELQNTLQSKDYLSDEYITERVLSIFGDGDVYEEVQKQKTAEDMERMGAITAQTSEGIDIDETIDNAEKIGGQLNGAQTQSLVSVVQQYASGALTEGQAANIISKAIGVTRDEALEILKS